MKIFRRLFNSNKNNSVIDARYRTYLILTYYCVNLFIVLFEIIMYLLLSETNTRPAFFDSYFITEILLPLVVALVATTAAYFVNRLKRASENVKTLFVIYAPLIVCISRCLFHIQYGIVDSCLTMPIFIAALFGFVSSIMICGIASILTIVAKFIYFVVNNYPSNEIFNEAVALLIVSIAITFAFVLIQYGNENKEELKQSMATENELRNKLKHDTLTGLFNLSAFLESVKNELEKQDSKIAVALLDLDDFKMLNDSFGHENANKVLKTIADIMLSNCRTGDIVCRYGGEEFTVMFKNCYLPEARAAVERILEQFSSVIFKFENANGEIIEKKVTFSGGVCLYKAGESVSEFIDRADRLMYEAKIRGKNQVVAR